MRTKARQNPRVSSGVFSSKIKSTKPSVPEKLKEEIINQYLRLTDPIALHSKQLHKKAVEEQNRRARIEERSTLENEDGVIDDNGQYQKGYFATDGYDTDPYDAKDEDWYEQSGRSAALRQYRIRQREIERQKDSEEYWKKQKALQELKNQRERAITLFAAAKKSNNLSVPLELRDMISNELENQAEADIIDFKAKFPESKEERERRERLENMDEHDQWLSDNGYVNYM